MGIAGREPSGERALCIRCIQYGVGCERGRVMNPCGACGGDDCQQRDQPEPDSRLTSRRMSTGRWSFASVAYHLQVESISALRGDAWRTS